MLMGILVLSACSPPETVFDGFGDGAHKLRVVNRQATSIEDRHGVRVSPRSGNGVAWVEGTDFRAGTIEIDIRGGDFAHLAPRDHADAMTDCRLRNAHSERRMTV